MSNLKHAIAFGALLAATALIGCKDQVSSIGSAYFPDTVQFQTSVRTDTGFMHFHPVSQPVVTASGQVFNITEASPLMMVGASNDAHEQLESWGLFRFSPISNDPANADTLNHVVGVRLLLKDIPYKYGTDTTNNHIDFQVFFENKGTNSKISDSTTQLSKSDLSAMPVGSFVGDFIDSTDKVLAIPLDSATIIPQLSATSLAFVIAPGPTMTNVRGFGTSEYGVTDVNAVPLIEYTLRYGDTTLITYRSPVLDLHVVKDASVIPAHEFTLRGGLGLRDSIYFNLLRTGDSALLDQFSTINNAELVLHADLNYTRHSNISTDTLGPDIVQITNVLTAGTSVDSTVFWGNGSFNPTDMTVRFQLRGLFEYWLRNQSPTQNFGMELRSGYSGRTFTAGTGTIAVEDNTLNRWTFYGQDYPDSTKRPQLILSYSKLH
ncbi:MAG TPA: hypothetical protein VG537_07585 [Candidatus Kapabacteria bacterium]|jgi:hypothetical protein|nr:hypothetical protein [Candidatus Kapabacteria bacterium]